MSATAFVDRVFRHLPSRDPSRFEFSHWSHGGKSTNEGFGLLPISVDPDALIARVMDVGSYVGNVEHVAESRVTSGPENKPPSQVRFYQRVSIPVLGDVQHELVITDGGTRDGWRLAFWDLLQAPTNALNPKRGARSEYNVGAWLVKPGFVGYALSSAPRKGDVGRLKFAAMTRGADAAAAKVVRSNIEGMVAWARRG